MVLALSSSRDSCHVYPTDGRRWTVEPASLVKCIKKSAVSANPGLYQVQRTQDRGTLWRQATRLLLWCPKQMQQVAPQMKWEGLCNWNVWYGIKGVSSTVGPVNQLLTFVNVHLEVCPNLLRRLTEWFGTRHNRWTSMNIATSKTKL